jgi:5'-nucleotidase
MFERTKLPGLAGVPAFSVAASPAYIVVLAGLGAFGAPPALVLSGVNRGANAGHAILHSGTVGAALTAANNGARAMAVSLDVLSAALSTSESGGAAIAAIDEVDDEARHWATATALVQRLLPWLIDTAAGTVLNLNVPDRPASELVGVRRATLASFGQVQMAVAERGNDFVRTAIEEVGAERDLGTDVALLAEGYATVSPIRPPSLVSELTLPLDLVRSG